MPDPSDAAEKPIVYYDQPLAGQRFIRRDGLHKYTEGHVVGVTVDGQHPGPDGVMRDAWYAVIQYDTTQEYRFNFQTRIVEGAVQWQPVAMPGTVQAVDECYNVLGDEIVQVREALRDGLQELRAEVVDLSLKLDALRLVACDPVDATPETVEPSLVDSGVVDPTLVDEPEATGRRRRLRRTGA